MNKHIYITRKIPETGLQILRDNNISFDIGNNSLPPTKKELIKILKKKSYDGVICFLTDIIDKDIFEASPSVKIFANFSVGFDNIDLNEAKKRGIIITNVPNTSSTAVAEHTVALMMALTTRLNEGDRFMRKGKYKGWDPSLFIGTDLKSKTIGLIGGGAIATEVAHILYNGFGLNILYNDIRENKLLGEKYNAKKMELDDILKNADIISLHVPLLPTTRHLISRDKLLLMKKTAFLINTSRGPVVDEIELVRALKDGVIKGAGLDVFEFEPKLAKGLSKLENIVLTPHIASARESARNMMSEIAAKNIVSLLIDGNALNNVI